MHPVDDDRLVTAVEIAELLGLKDGQAVLDLRRHQFGFPGPVARRARALVWSWDSVEAWVTVSVGTVTGPLGDTLTAYAADVALEIPEADLAVSPT